MASSLIEPIASMRLNSTTHHSVDPTPENHHYYSIYMPNVVTEEQILEMFRELRSRDPALPVKVVPDDAQFTETIRTPATETSSELVDRSTCLKHALFDLPADILPWYMDPFHVRAEPQELVRAWYGIPCHDALVFAFALENGLISIDGHVKGEPIFDEDLARDEAIAELSRRLELPKPLAFVGVHGCGKHLLGLCTNHNLHDVPNLVEYKAAQLLDMLEYPVVPENAPKWYIARKQI